MSGSNPSSNSIILNIEARGLDVLDHVVDGTKKIDLATRYTAASLAEFDSHIRSTVGLFGSYREAIQQTARTQDGLSTSLRNIARDVLSNDKLIVKSQQDAAKETERAANDRIKAARREADESIAAAQRAYKARQDMANMYKSFLRDSMRDETKEARETQYGKMHLMTAFGREAGLGTVGTNLSRGIAGVTGGFGPYGMVGTGLLAAAGVGTAVGAVRGGYSMVKDAAQDAQEMSNLAREFDVSTSKIFQFQAAARLTGQDLGTLSAAARKLSEAIEAPGTTGKKTADALAKMGVSVRDGMGGALTEVIDNLSKITNSAQGTAAAVAVFGREGAKMWEIARATREVGVGMDDGLIQKLAEANQKLEAFDLRWTVLKANIAGGIILPIVAHISAGDQSAGNSSIGGLFSSLASALSGDPTAFASIAANAIGLQRTAQPPMPARAGGNVSLRRTYDDKIQNAIEHDGSKLGLQQQIEEERAKYQDTLSQYNQARTANEKQDVVDGLGKQVLEHRARIAQLQKMEKAPGVENRIQNELDSLREQVSTGDELSPYARIDRQQERFFQTNRDNLQGPANSRYRIEAGADFGLLKYQARQRVQSELADKADSIQAEVDRAGEKQADELMKAAREGNSPLSSVLFGGLTDEDIKRNKFQSDEAKKNSEDIRGMYGAESGMLTRSYSLQNQLRSIRGDNTPGSQYGSAVDEAQALLNLHLKDASEMQDADERRKASIQALYEYIEQGDEARIQREEQIAQKAQQQKDETGSFFSSWFSAAISGQPGASGNFMRGFGREQMGKIINNVAGETIGSANKWMSLGGTGIMGTSDQPNFLGKALKGVFGLDFDHSKDPTVKATDENTRVTKDNTDMTKALASAVNNLLTSNGLPGVQIPGGGGGGGASSGYSGGGSGSSSTGADLASGLQSMTSHSADLMKAVQSGDPKAIVSSASNLISSASKLFGGSGSSSRSASASLSSLIPKGGDGAYSQPFSATSFPSFSLPDLGLGLDGGSAGSSLGNTDISTGDPSSILANATRIQGASAAPTDSASDLINGANKSVSAFGKAMGNFGDGVANGMSGYGLEDLGDWSGDPMGLAGSVTAMGGSAATGILGAIKGFGQGGARGDIGGVASLMGGLSPLAGPFAPFMQAAAAALGLVTSLFSDPRQDRINQEQKSLVLDQYLRPAAHDYTFNGATGQGGFGYSEGGGMTSGPISNNTVHLNVNAIDTKSFYDNLKSDPNELGSALLMGLDSSSSSAIGNLIAYYASRGGA